MDKRLVLLLILFLLSGCHNKSLTACVYSKDSNEVYIDIEAINDDISNIHIRNIYKIPNKVVADKEKYDFILSQVDDTYHFEDNLLVKEYDADLSDTYSLALTKDHLKNMRFYCE